ncbi:MAG TPA: hypothetical protein PK228_15165 [Saprospiraceae bacterium]|nr:hypothetical protein [Saprospiraceae bacterium]
MRFFPALVFIQVLIWIVACNQTQPSQQGSANTAAAFQFSKSVAVTHPEAEGNWCNNQFTDAVLINADTANTNRRYFLLGDGIYRVATQLGNMTSSFLLRKQGDRAAELFTSDNFPLCLSKREYFSLADGGAFFSYDNRKGINYTVELQPTAEGPFIILVFPPGLTYGLNVHHCVGCR